MPTLAPIKPEFRTKCSVEANRDISYADNSITVKKGTKGTIEEKYAQVGYWNVSWSTMSHKWLATSENCMDVC